ncbi:MAG TPA: DegT/DnrJ/EryC1/StrS family aminotransferase [Phycisphaerae bacterium]|nr:DegT/DnrJ/EryC1/StrS family aminotransferase [Phycisphaerae bacterium]HPS53377.1 DegT/DnrJ/EryC1/StrS family aminotransferase [Phycisphaerae bacterium]
MKVPLLDLTAQYAGLKSQIMPAVEAVLDSQMVCNGPAVRQFESQIASYCGSKHGVGVSSGTDALLCALMALGIGPGDEVIIPPFTFFATAGVVWRVGAKPVFVDIQPDTFNIDPDLIAPALTPRTKAIIPVHLFGQTADMDEIMGIAASHDLYVVEDAAQSIGSAYKGHRACSIGTVGCLSFYPTKNLGACGDAGMCITGDDEIAAKLERTRNHGQGGTYMHETVGGNFRMDTVQAAILSVKLAVLDDWHEGRRRNAAIYDEKLAGLDGIILPHVRRDNYMIYNQYTIRVKNSRRDALKKFLADNEIASGVYYPLSLHQQECFASLGYRQGDFPVSEMAAAEVLSLPITGEISPQQIEFVAQKVREFAS